MRWSPPACGTGSDPCRTAWPPQRQRLALARALLADVRILVLDEPTEHLDEATARAFVADLDAALAGRTVLVLTHRPELFRGAGWIPGPTMVPADRP
jgi:ABC-type protease/lipase transport system fused ATPase/permease subunit